MPCLSATSVPVRGLQSACNHRCHCRSGLRARGREHEPCQLAGAVHGFGKRGWTVCIVNEVRAGDEPEPLAQKLPTSLTTFVMLRSFSCFCASGGGGALHGMGRDAKRRGCGERWFTSHAAERRARPSWDRDSTQCWRDPSGRVTTWSGGHRQPPRDWRGCCRAGRQPGTRSQHACQARRTWEERRRGAAEPERRYAERAEPARVVDRQRSGRIVGRSVVSAGGGVCSSQSAQPTDPLHVVMW